MEWTGYGLQVNPQCHMFGPPTPPIIEFLDLRLQSALELNQSSHFGYHFPNNTQYTLLIIRSVKKPQLSEYSCTFHTIVMLFPFKRI